MFISFFFFLHCTRSDIIRSTLFIVFIHAICICFIISIYLLNMLLRYTYITRYINEKKIPVQKSMYVGIHAKKKNNNNPQPYPHVRIVTREMILREMLVFCVCVQIYKCFKVFCSVYMCNMVVCLGIWWFFFFLGVRCLIINDNDDYDDDDECDENDNVPVLVGMYMVYVRPEE